MDESVAGTDRWGDFHRRRASAQQSEIDHMNAWLKANGH